MGKISLAKIVMGCPITEFLFGENARELCDIFVFGAGIVLILALVYAKRRIHGSHALSSE